MSLQHAFQCAYDKRLDEVIGASGGKRLGLRRGVRVTGEEDNRHLAPGREFTNAARRRKAVEQRKSAVHQNQVGKKALRQSGCNLPVFSFNDADAAAHLKYCSEHEARVWMVFDDEDEGRRGRGSATRGVCVGWTYVLNGKSLHHRVSACGRKTD